MKPDAHQDELLRKYLRKALRYRETYEEVYDHVLNALNDDTTNNQSFEDSINLIILNDFGGPLGLKRMERNREKTFFSALKKKQLNYFKAWFDMPLLPVVVGMVGVVYYLGTVMPFVMTMLMLLVCVIMPMVLINIRYFKTGRIFGDTKKSIADYPFRRIAFLPLNVLYMGTMLSLAIYVFQGGLNLHFSRISTLPGEELMGVKISQIVYSIMFVLFILNEVSFYKLYKEEFKTVILK